MKVLFFLRYSRMGASSRIRGFYVAEELSEKLNGSIAFGFSPVTYLKVLVKLFCHDIIFFQKCNSIFDVILNRFARAIGKKTVFDIDDAPFGVKGKQRTERQTINMMKASSAVIVASHRLAEYAQQYNNNVHLIPTSINLKYYMQRSSEHRNREITLGWIGNGPSYKNDLKVLIDPLERIGKNHPIKLVIIGALGDKDIHEMFGRMKHVTAEIIDTLNWTDPMAGPKAIAGFDIGLYPLTENKYNIYKGGYKALEYMATGSAVIAAPIGENKYIIKHESDGYLVDTPDLWYKYILKLIEDTPTRRKIIQSARKKIEKDYSICQSAIKLLKIFESLER